MSIQGMPSLSCLCTQSLDFNKMNIRFITLFAGVLLCVTANAQTQADLNDDACATYQAADKKLNAVYQQVLKQHQDDVNFTAKLRKAQRAWLAFRDTELEAIYPAANKQVEYGSVYSMCNCLEQTALINQRIEQLSGWLDAEEGDVCRGSR